MIEELLGSIQELSAGSQDVVAAVETVADLTRTTEVAVDRSSEGMEESLQGMEAVAEIASRVRAETAEMSRRFEGIREDADEVRALGGDNLETIQGLKASLEGFSRKDAAPGAL